MIKEKIENYLLYNFGWKINLTEKEIDAKIDLIAKELHFDSRESFIFFFETNPKDEKLLKAFAKEFTICESYFFRDLTFFRRFEYEIIPKILKKDEKRLAIWSVGCSRGEELYSVAMMLDRLIPDIKDWNLYLVGTDVNSEMLEKAKNGLFNKYSLRQMPDIYMNYFDTVFDGYKLHENIKKMTQFKFHNIMDSTTLCLPIDGKGFDLILINNILIYFTTDYAKTIAHNLYNSLTSDGSIATTPTELSMGIFDFIAHESLKDGYIIQKTAPTLKVLDKVEVKHQAFNVSEDIVLEQHQMKKVDFIETRYDAEYHEALKKIESGDLEGAKVSLKRVIYLNDKFIMAYIILGNLLKKEGKLKSALKYLKSAKISLQRLDPQIEVELSDGIKASDLLSMINKIEGESI